MCCIQGRTDSGHLYVMDPADMLSTGARGIGSSPLHFEMKETGHPGAPLLQSHRSLSFLAPHVDAFPH